MRKKTAFTIGEFTLTILIVALCVQFFTKMLDNLSSEDRIVNSLQEVQEHYSKLLKQYQSYGNPVHTWNWQGDEYTVAYRIMSEYLTDSKRVSCDNPLMCVGGFSSLNQDNYTNYRQSTDFARFLVGKKKMHVALLPSGNCANSRGSLCGILYVDINNKDMPNKLGYDVFMFGIYGDGDFVPYGYYGTKKDINRGCNKFALGETCAAKIMADNWSLKKTKPNIYPIYDKTKRY